MNPSLAGVLKWAAFATFVVAALALMDATPLLGNGWNRGRLIGAALGGALGVMLLALRKVLEALPGKHELQEMRRLVEFACQRAEAARLGQAVYVGDDTALTLLEPAHPIYVDTRCRQVAPHLITQGMWEPQYTGLFRRLLRPGDTVLDIGANHGVYAIHSAGVVGREGRVHAFEPNPKLAGLILRSTQVNGYGDRLTVHACAIGERSGEVDLTFSDGGSGGGSTHAITGPLSDGLQRLRVPCVALDDLFPSPGFVVQAIKMDIEGAEGVALRGMQQLLKRSPDVRILMEYAPAMLRASGSSPEEVIDGLAALGFRFWTVRSDGGTDPVQAAALVQTSVSLQNLLVSRQDLP